MLEIIAIRHGITTWNQLKRIQGRTDIPLAEQGIQRLQQYQIPEAWHQLPWFCSPLLRTQQTARVLGLTPKIQEALIEMHWGDWEGQTISELRQRYGQAFSDMEAQGLDMHPTGGESPRLVRERITRWVSAFDHASLPPTMDTDEAPASTIGMVTHKGVIRAMLSAACDWDMRHKPPVKLNYQAAQRFGWCAEDGWCLLEPNIRLLDNE